MWHRPGYGALAGRQLTQEEPHPRRMQGPPDGWPLVIRRLPEKRSLLRLPVVLPDRLVSASQQGVPWSAGCSARRRPAVSRSLPSIRGFCGASGWRRASSPVTAGRGEPVERGHPRCRRSRHADCRREWQSCLNLLCSRLRCRSRRRWPDRGPACPGIVGGWVRYSRPRCRASH